MQTAHGVTHIGHVRKTNEDTLVVDPDIGLYLVADGLGWHAAGGVASRLTAETIRSFIARSLDGGKCTWPYGIDPDASFAANRLRTALQLANRRVFRAGESRDDYTGMGSTVVAALLEGDHMVYAGVGDSRIYSLAQSGVEQLTSDDSWVATVLARDPEFDEAAIAEHPMRHVLTSAVGARDDIDFDVGERTLAPGETVLLSSDGLHGALDAQTLTALMGSDDEVAVITQRLVDGALERDASDNITALLLRQAG